MAETLAQQMVTKLETLLLENAGLSSVSVDGEQVSYADLEAKYEHWSRKLKREQAKAATVSKIKLGGIYG